MDEYDFQLHYQLPDNEPDAEVWLDALFEAGCDDALVGVAVPGQISLDFTRQAVGPVEALRSALRDLTTAVPGGRLISVGPDLLNLSELAEWLSFRLATVSRQAMRKYATGEIRKAISRFPPPALSGSTSLWHLDEVLTWMRDNGKITEDKLSRAARLIDLAETVRVVNVAGEYAHSKASHPVLADEAGKLIKA